MARRWLPFASIPLVLALALGVLALRAQPHPVAATLPACSTPDATGAACPTPSPSVTDSPSATAADAPSATAAPTATATAAVAPPSTATARPSLAPTPFPSTGESAVLVPCGAGPQTGFGRAVAITPDGNELVVGAIDTNNDGNGAAYILIRSARGWAQQARLTVADAPSGAFGKAVAVSSDGATVLIGADLAGDGKAYVFSRDSAGWHQTAELAANDGRSFGDAFGASVSLSGDGLTALISRPGYSWPSSAYVFTKTSGWALAAKLTAAPGHDNDGFGTVSALSSSGTRLVLGAPGASTAYVYDLAGGSWTQSAALTAAGASALGSEVAISGDGETVLAADSGFYASTAAVHAFKYAAGTWTGDGLLSNPATTNGGFGIALAMSADSGVAVVGDYGPNFNHGTSFLFTRSGASWAMSRQLPNPLPADYDSYGTTVAVSADGSVVAIGAALRDNPGAVVVFDSTNPSGPPQTLSC